MATWNDLFDAALSEIGVLEAGGTGATADRTYCLGVVNRMLSRWSAELGPIHFQTTDNLSWGSGNASRTIGSGGNFSVTRPEMLVSAYYRDSGNNDHEIDLISYAGYQAITNKTHTSESPLALAYNPTIASGLGTLYIWPVPSSTITIPLTSLKPFTAISDQTATVTLPSGYEGAIVPNLSVLIAPAFGATLSEITVMEARKSKAALVQANLTFNPPSPDPLAPGAGSGYDARAHWNIP